MDNSDPNKPAEEQTTPLQDTPQETPDQQAAADSSGAPIQQDPQSSDQVSESSPPEETDNPQGDYVENVGGTLIDLLTDISLSDNLKQKVADAMKLPVEQITPILDGLLDKIDNEQVTEAELALIMTAPVADETSEQEQSV